MAESGPSDRDALVALLKARSVRFGEFTLASGARSSYYVDCRPSTMSAAGQRLIGRMGLAAIRAAGWAPGSVGGLTMGADPVAYAIAGASGDESRVAGRGAIDAFSVRKQPKDHGTGKRIEGNFDPAVPVVVIEDVITSGGSALDAVAAVREAGGTVLGVFAVLDRQAGGRERIEAAGLPVVTLVTAGELGVGEK
ncbi:MAG: orotate phosphoribosyltransferase [Gemmatimonadales bacterium]